MKGGCRGTNQGQKLSIKRRLLRARIKFIKRPCPGGARNRAPRSRRVFLFQISPLYILCDNRREFTAGGTKREGLEVKGRGWVGVELPTAHLTPSDFQKPLTCPARVSLLFAAETIASVLRHKVI